MAQIVLGMAIPHSGMLGKAPEEWLEDGLRDHHNQMLWFRNQHWQYPDLEKARKHENLKAFLTLEERQSRAKRTRAALDELARIYKQHKPDVAIIIGKDQKEIFIDTSPSLAIYTGEDLPNGPPQRPVFAPDKPVVHKAHPQLALHLISSLEQAGFDVAEVLRWPDNVWMKPPQKIVPHAYGFIYRQIMGDDPPPNVPVFMNVFYPPNQPPFKRAMQIGHALFKAIQDWDSDQRVALIASGGMSHFVCDEELDQIFLKCFKTFDFERLAQIDERSYQAGTSEVKLYVPVMLAMSQLGAQTNLIDYVPCYRTEAGTGEGFGFMYWTPTP
jgi:3-O-methylgallate 3,4-dioxygenase